VTERGGEQLIIAGKIAPAVIRMKEHFAQEDGGVAGETGY
jgi:hypothetical protein